MNFWIRGIKVMKAKIIEDSINENGVRLTTMQLEYPRFIHGEFLVHRVFSRNSSSSRAIPTSKMATGILGFVEPIRYGKNQPGMQASKDNLEGAGLAEAKKIWYEMARFCAEGAKRLSELGLHKQWASRPLEWFSNINTVVTATEWLNWNNLRDHCAAQPEIQALAQAMKAAHNASTPKLLKDGEWHIPYVSEAERSEYSLKDTLKFSAARCARVSYLNHDQSTPTPAKDIDLHDKLVKSVPAHMSPVEHQAQSRAEDKFFANFNGFKQYRKYLEEM
jgi:thymidylate synthase ThyX